MTTLRPTTIQLAKDLSKTVIRLNALVIPLAAGGRDSHDQRIGTDESVRESLSEALGDARVAIEIAQNRLAQGSVGHNPS